MYLIYILNFIILILLIVLLPVIIAALALKPKFRAGFWQKLCCYKKLPKSPEAKHIVIHAVSVGEVIAVEKFIKVLRDNFPTDKIILTTVTKTGNTVANQKLSNIVDEIIYFPFDLFFAVKSFVKNIKPDIVIIAETEIWPFFALELKNHKIPVIIINGRISPNSHNGYKKFRWFFKHVLSCYTKILMQTSGDMQRIIDVGANPKITEIMGNLKFDIEKNLSSKEIENLKSQFQSEGKPVFIAGSTHKGEDEIVLKAYKKLCQKVPKTKLILAPRHPERLKDVENLLKTEGFLYGKRSQGSNFEDNQVILLDTMGELSKLYAISNVAFIGGSFSGTGGHNPLEAAIYDIPVISGPSTFNFKDIYKFLTDYKASFIVNDENELSEKLEKLFTDNDFYSQTSQSCGKVFVENSGAIENAIKAIKEIL